MSLFQVFDIAGSGMSAQAIRLNTVSSNMANAKNVSSNPQDIYRAKNPVFQSVMRELTGGGSVSGTGVKVLRIDESQTEGRKLYNPNNPMADKEGYVYQSNVNVIEEMANMISASRSYQNNVEVLNTAKQLMTATIRLGE